MRLKALLTGHLSKRIVGTLLYGLPFVWLIIAGDGALFIGMIAITTIIAYEFCHIMRRGGHRVFPLLSIIGALAFIFDAHLKVDILRPGLAIVIMLSIVWARFQTGYDQSAEADPNYSKAVDWSLILIVPVYTGALLSHVLLLRSLSQGMSLLLAASFGAAACDSASFLVGSYLGRHKFFAHISPKKTWEGAISGLFSSVLMIYLLGPLLQIEKQHALFLGVTVGIFTIFGDLTESMFKRYAGVKDSGSWIPEQGGLFDVLDGFMWAVPAVYYYATLVMGLS